MRATVREITQAVKGRLLCGDENTVIEHLSIDSRVSEGNDLFVPIIGAKVDAHRFIEQAFAAGCAATLTSRDTEKEDPDHPWIYVEDTVDALHEIGRLCRSGVTIPAVGVTGSVGKTTTREMIACALSAERKVYKTEKNYNSSVGVPITMSRMSNDYDVAVLELGMNMPGELGMISGIAKPKIAVITNIGVAHIEFFGTREAICREKYTITEGFDGEGLLVLNGDDPLLYEYRESTGYPYILYGTNARCEYRAENIRMVNGHYCFDYVHNGSRTPVALSVLGRHNVQNATAALAVAEQFGIKPAAAAAALAGFAGYQGRLQPIPMDGYTVIDDTYNANPDSMTAGIRALSDFETEGRRIAVLGDMKELGPDSPDYHRQVGKRIAKEPLAQLLLIGELAACIGEGAKEAGASYPIFRMESNEAAARYLQREHRQDDVIYLKASHSMKLEEIVAMLGQVREEREIAAMPGQAREEQETGR